MPFKFTLLLLLSFSTIHAKDNLNPIERLLGNDSQPLKSEISVNKLENDGVISGQLFDRDSGELISNDIFFVAKLFKKHPRFDDWLYIKRIDSENGAYEFSGLEHGQYIVSTVVKGGYTDLEVFASKAYLNSTWSASGNHTCINCNLDSDRIISINADRTSFNADFELEQGGLLAVTLTNDDLERSDNFRVIAIDENNEVFDNSIQLTTVRGVGFPLTTGVEIKAISKLPAGSYRFFTETHQFIDKTNQGIPCEYCEFEVLQDQTSHLSVVNKQITETDIALSKPTSSVSGRVDDKDPNDRTHVRLINYNQRNQFGQFLTIEPFEFTLAGINPGIYFLRNLSYFTEGSFHYQNLYGGGYCQGVSCDLTDAKPIIVTENQDIVLKPYTMPSGGAIIGMINDLNGNRVLPDPSLRSYIDQHYAEFYDANQRYVGSQEIITYLSGQFRSNRISHVLPPGEYYVKTGSSRKGDSNRHYVDQIYPGINCAGFYCDFSEAELVTVEVGETVSDINFNLEHGYGIRGKVTDANYHELKDINILVHDEDFNFLGTTLTDDSGDYGFFNLPYGDYYVSTANGSQSFKAEYEYPETNGFQDQLYPNVQCPNGICDLGQGQKITVQDSDITAINFQLSSGLALSGTVTDSKTGQPIEHLSVGVYQVDGTHIADYKTNHLGFYTTGALQSGDYLIKTQAHNLYPEFVLGYGTCLFGNCTANDGTVFTITENQSVDFAISHKKDLYAAFSGNWFQPDESGHGFQFEVIEQNEASHLYVTWYAHLDGQPIWLTGTGLLLGDKAYVDLSITDGIDFPADNNIQHWGSLRVDFSDLNHATASWQPVVAGFNNGELEIERLTALSTNNPTGSIPESHISACFSGSYYDSNRSGEGLVVEVLGETADRLLITWYSYRGDEQFWMLGVGDLVGNSATIPMHYTQGSSFTPDFNSNDLETLQWGEVTVSKIDDLNIGVEFKPSSTHTDFETKQSQLTKLTEIQGLSCQQ